MTTGVLLLAGLMPGAEPVPPPRVQSWNLPAIPTVRQRHIPLYTPVGVSAGMTRAEAAVALRAGGFDFPQSEVAAVTGVAALVPAPVWHLRKPWRGGYHYVTVRFDGNRVTEVQNMLIDP